MRLHIGDLESEICAASAGIDADFAIWGAYVPLSRPSVCYCKCPSNVRVRDELVEGGASLPILHERNDPAK